MPNGYSIDTARAALPAMGQTLFEPPDVAGWALGTEWFGTGSMLARMNFAASLAGNQKFNLARAAQSARTTPERVLATIHQNPILREFLENRWIRLATMNPDDATDIQMYRWDGGWEAVTGDDERLQSAPTSLDWYRGHLEHLPIARIAPRVGTVAPLKVAS